MHEYIAERLRRNYIRFNNIMKTPANNTGPKYNWQMDCPRSLRKDVFHSTKHGIIFNK